MADELTQAEKDFAERLAVGLGSGQVEFVGATRFACPRCLRERDEVVRQDWKPRANFMNRYVCPVCKTVTRR